MIDDIYIYLMEKYKWTTDQIDGMDFYRVTDLIFKEVKPKEEPLQFIDQVLGT